MAQLTLADGQLTASAASIFDGNNNVRTLNVILHNTSASTTETVVLTFQRNGGTARRLAALTTAS